MKDVPFSLTPHTMAQMEADDLFTLAESLRGQDLYTERRKALFRVDVQSGNLEITPASGKLRHESRKSLDRVCKEYESSGSLAPKDYEDITFNSSYLVTLIRRHRDLNVFHLPEEPASAARCVEGSLQRIEVNRYERDPRARAACIAAHGDTCCICGFNFRTKYGEVGAGYIHVHHLRLLSEIGPNYDIDPLEDLRPVCPNCHAILHRRDPPYELQKVREMIR